MSQAEKQPNVLSRIKGAVGSIGTASTSPTLTGRLSPRDLRNARSPNTRSPKHARPRKPSTGSGATFVPADFYMIQDEESFVDAKANVESPEGIEPHSPDESRYSSPVQESEVDKVLRTLQVARDLDRQQEIEKPSIIKELETTVEQLRQQLKTEQENSQRSMHHTQLLLDSRELCIGAQDSDSSIVTSFRSLFSRIRSWVAGLTKLTDIMIPTVSGTNAEAIKAFSELILAFDQQRTVVQHLSGSVKSRRWIIRAGFAASLCLNIFRSADRTFLSAQGEAWLDDNMSQAFVAIEERLIDSDRSQIPLKALHDWRALTAELLSKVDINEQAQKYRDQVLSDASAPLLWLASHWVATEDRRRVELDLRMILEEAIRCAAMLRRQRASWSVRFPIHRAEIDMHNGVQPSNIVFDRDTMEDVEEDVSLKDDDPKEQRLVELFVQPALFKRGDKDGNDFDYEACLSRAVVERRRRPGKLQRIMKG